MKTLIITKSTKYKIDIRLMRILGWRVKGE